MRRRLAARLGVEPTREAVGAARLDALRATRARRTCRACGRTPGSPPIVVDEGYPQPSIPSAELQRRGRAAGAPRGPHRALDRPAEARARRASTSSRTRSCAEAERAPNETRRRLQVDHRLPHRPRRAAVEPRATPTPRSRAGARTAGAESREHAKPVRDNLLRRTFEIAAAAGGLPVHIHCGGGDPSIVLGHARPQDLFPLLSERTAPADAADPLGPAVARRGRVRGVDPAPRLPRDVDHDAVGVAGDRHQAGGAARHRAAVEGALRLRRGERARGAVAVGAGRPRGAGARAGDGASSATGSTPTRRSRSARACSVATPRACTGSSCSAPRQRPAALRR